MNKENTPTPTKNSPLQVITRRRLVMYGGLAVLNILIFGLTDPLRSSILVVIGGFLIASLDILFLTHALIRFIEVLIPKVSPYRRRLTMVIGGFEIVVLALASIGQLTWRDLLVVIIVGAVSYFYSLYFRLWPKRS